METFDLVAQILKLLIRGFGIVYGLYNFYKDEKVDNKTVIMVIILTM